MENVESRWIREKNLGTGSFGVVDLWRNNCTGNAIAIKQCRGGVSLLTEKQKERWLKEVENMNSLNHPNIVGTRNLPSQLYNIVKGIPVLCMEYCSGGDLRTVLNQSENCCGIEEPEALKIMQNISSAVKYLHSRTLVHRDLKPENIVLQRTRKETIYKLTDLGYLRELGEKSLDASVVGTRNYLAPELLWKDSYSCSVDYWSLGILFYEIITGNRPFLPNIPMTMTWMRHIKEKKFEDICIHGSHGTISYSNEIERPSTISDCMRSQLTTWFRVALQWDPRRRGKLPEGQDQDNIVIFSLLDEILAGKIVYTFVATLYRFDTFVVHPNVTVQEMQKLISEKTGIELAHQTLTSHLGHVIHQADDSLFSCIDEPHLIVLQRDKLLVENTPKSEYSPPVKFIMDNPRDMLDYETIRRSYAASLSFIKKERELFKAYVITISIKIDLSITNLEDLLENVEKIATNAKSLMDRLVEDEQSPEYSSMNDKLRETFERTKGKTQTIVNNAKEIRSNLDALSSYSQKLQNFSNLNWLEDWTQLYETATNVYEASLRSDPGQRDRPVAMFKLINNANKIKHQQLRSPDIKEFLRSVNAFDMKILQLQKSLNSFEVLVDVYRRDFDDILLERAAVPPTTRSMLCTAESDTIMIDNIMLNELFGEVVESLQSRIMDLADLQDLEDF